MSTNLNYKQVTNVARRTWDKEAYEKRAQDRANHESGTTTTTTTASTSSSDGRFNRGDVKVGSDSSTAIPTIGGANPGEIRAEFLPAPAGAAGPHMSKRAFLKARTGRLDDVIDSKIGSVEIVHPDAVSTTASSATAAASGSIDNGTGVTKSGVGWHCKVCDCFLRDSLTYLDHINGRKHQRNLGYSMRVERSTNDQVMARLAVLAKEKEASKSKADRLMDGYDENDGEEEGGYYNDIVKAKDEELAKRKEERRRERKERKKKKREEKMTTSADHQDEQEYDDEVKDDARFGKVTTTTEPDNDEEDEEEGVDPGLAAMMGFTGFGGGTKKK